MARSVRHVSARDRWEQLHAAPDPRLSGYVLGYCAYDETTTSFTRRRELPGVRVVLVVNLGAPIRVRIGGAEAPRRADAAARGVAGAGAGAAVVGGAAPSMGFVSGLTGTFAVTETVGVQRGVQVDLSPVGAHLLLREPMRDLRGVVGLEELFGQRGALLHEALAGAPDAAARFALLDAFWLARLDDALSPVPSVTRALARLHASGGAVPIAALTAELGCSPRHLTERFREQVGIAPKLYGRILRFQRALALAGGERDWAVIAARCGYYDQAHMVRDFHAFAGGSPTEIARRRLPDGGGVRDD